MIHELHSNKHVMFYDDNGHFIKVSRAILIAKKYMSCNIKRVRYPNHDDFVYFLFDDDKYFYWVPFNKTTVINHNVK